MSLNLLSEQLVLVVMLLATNMLSSQVGLPGMSTRVKLGTTGEYTVSWIGSADTTLPLVCRYRMVSASISFRIATAEVFVFVSVTLTPHQYTAHDGSLA